MHWGSFLRRDKLPFNARQELGATGTADAAARAGRSQLRWDLVLAESARAIVGQRNVKYAR